MHKYKIHNASSMSEAHNIYLKYKYYVIKKGFNAYFYLSVLQKITTE